MSPPLVYYFCMTCFCDLCSKRKHPNGKIPKITPRITCRKAPCFFKDTTKLVCFSSCTNYSVYKRTMNWEFQPLLPETSPTMATPRSARNCPSTNSPFLTSPSTKIASSLVFAHTRHRNRALGVGYRSIDAYATNLSANRCGSDAFVVLETS